MVLDLLLSFIRKAEGFNQCQTTTGPKAEKFLMPGVKIARAAQSMQKAGSPNTFLKRADRELHFGTALATANRRSYPLLINRMQP